MPTFRIACACLLVGSAAAAQDYRVTAEQGIAFGCLQKEDVQEFVDTGLAVKNSKDEEELAYNNSVHIQVVERVDRLWKQDQCTIYRANDRMVLIGEDEADPDWIQVGKRSRFRAGEVSREMWTFREWFEPVP